MNIAVIMAGGEGSRMKAKMPKQYLDICGRQMISYSLETFAENEETDEIYVVCAPEFYDTVSAVSLKYCSRKFEGCIPSGSTRRLSSKNAAEYLSAIRPADSTVMIHDAARPGISDEIIKNNIKTARETGACCTAIYPKDTLCRVSGGILGKTVEREKTVILQTPQTFRLEIIKRAHDFYDEDARKGQAPDITDDTGLVRLMGIPVAVVEGSAENLKITEPSDIKLFESYLRGKEVIDRTENVLG